MKHQDYDCIIGETLVDGGSLSIDSLCVSRQWLEEAYIDCVAAPPCVKGHPPGQRLEVTHCFSSVLQTPCRSTDVLTKQQALILYLNHR